MKIRQVAKISNGQDGAIYGTELFRFGSGGGCSVYSMVEAEKGNGEELTTIARFKLDKYDIIVPHSNSVCFGSEFYDKDDRYPLLYTNIYNNYKKEEDKKIGICLVYRIQRTGNEFKSTLVQSIEIGFCEDSKLWKAYPDKHGVRPYGNFVVDVENGSIWAFVMRNEALGSRYFRFNLPSVHDGETDEQLNIKKVVLKPSDIQECFDSEYHRYMQGAILNKGKIYSTEGFSNNPANIPAIRIIDLATKQEQYFDITKQGLENEPEFIDFYNDKCYYSDLQGNLYTVEF